MTTTAHAPHHPMAAFGIDIGGSGIKGAPVDLRTGAFSGDRVRIPTPQPSTPQAVAATVAALVDSFDLPHDLPVGVTFPAVIQHGVARSAAHSLHDNTWPAASPAFSAPPLLSPSLPPSPERITP